MIEDKEGLFSKDYVVIFTDGKKLEFDSKGNWKSINFHDTEIPAAMLPEQIVEYVKTQYPGQIITKIEKENKKYEVDLNNGLELIFNNKFQFIKLDR